MRVPGEGASSRYILRVRFGETDLMGIVHHAAYVMYMEAGRVEYLGRRGVDYGTCARDGIHLPVVELGLRYRKSARFGDRVIIESRVDELSRVTVKFVYRILRDDPAEMLLVEGHTLLACVGHDLAPKRIPNDLAETLCGPEKKPRPIDQA